MQEKLEKILSSGPSAHICLPHSTKTFLCFMLSLGVRSPWLYLSKAKCIKQNTLPNLEHIVRSIGEKFENCPFLPRR